MVVRSWKGWGRLRCAAVVSCLGVALAGCVGTDAPNDERDGFTPFEPDEGSDMDAAGDMDPPEMDVAGDMDAEPDMDSGDMDPPDMAPDMDPGVCRPNADLEITRDEVPIILGARATFRVALDAPVDTAGQPGEGDGRAWDLSAMLDGDQTITVEARAPGDFWFSEEFPDASYVTRLSETTTNLGIFRVTDSQLLLLGIASPTDGFTGTELTYDPPVVVLDFPLTVGKSWRTESSVSGTFNGAFVNLDEDYSVSVDAFGSLETPFGTFEQVLRIRTELDRSNSPFIDPFGFLDITTRTFSFVTECFGTVASVVSENDESEVEFTQAAEVRRLTP